MAREDQDPVSGKAPGAAVPGNPVLYEVCSIPFDTRQSAVYKKGIFLSALKKVSGGLNFKNGFLKGECAR
jgi:hypothetical protein